MSGFLRRTVARALAPERLLRPRVPSLYESFPQGGGWEERVVEAPAPTVTVRDERANRPAPVRETRPVDAGGPAEIVERVDVVTRETVRPVETVREQPVERVIERIDERHVHHTEPAAPAAPVIVERDVVAPPEVRTVTRTRRGLDRIERLRVRSERRTVERELVSEAPVEITIGRIDVRALVETARDTPRASRPSAPTMSLREYLAQRDARRRR